MSYYDGTGYQLGDGYGYPDSTTSSGIDFIQQSQDAIDSIQNSTQTVIDQQMAGMQTNAMNSLQSPIDARVMASAAPTDNSGGGLGGLLGGFSNAYSGASAGDTTGSVLSGAASGAMAGASFGPPGMIVGGIVGGVLGLFGSKSKKKAEKQAFQQQMQLAIAPQQQAEANYLQNQGLLQKAIGNYAQYYNPQGPTSQFTNKLLANKPGTTSPFTYAPATGEMPNFAVMPSNVATGKITPTSGIPIPTYQGQAAPQNLIAPPTQLGTPKAPAFTGNQALDSQNLAAYQKQYTDYLTQQNQQGQLAAMKAYSGY